MRKPEPLDRVHSVARLRHLSLGTERAYSDWIKRFILFQRKRHPEEMGAEEIRQFLSHLAVEGGSRHRSRVWRPARGSPSTETCFRLNYLTSKASGGRSALRASPVVFTRAGGPSLMSLLPGTYGLIAGLLYGAGPGPREAARLRGRDFDFEYMIRTRNGRL